MSDYTQVTFFAPKDELATGNPSKLIKGSEVDPELSSIATAIATKFDTGDVADDATAAALVSTSTLISPARLKYALENGSFALSFSGPTELATAAASDDMVLIYDTSATTTKKVSVTNLFSGQGFVPNSRTITAGLGLDGTGDLSANRTFNVLAGAGLTFSGDDLVVGQGSGISVTSDAVAVDRTNLTATDATGYIDTPINTQSTNYTFALTDRGKTVYHPNGAGADTFTVPNNSSVAFPNGTVITIWNDDTSNVTLAQDSGVSIRLAGTTAFGNRTVGQFGLVSLLKYAENSWVASGAGLT